MVVEHSGPLLSPPLAVLRTLCCDVPSGMWAVGVVAGCASLQLLCLLAAVQRKRQLLTWRHHEARRQKPRAASGPGSGGCHDIDHSGETLGDGMAEHRRGGEQQHHDDVELSQVKDRRRRTVGEAQPHPMVLFAAHLLRHIRMAAADHNGHDEAPPGNASHDRLDGDAATGATTAVDADAWCRLVLGTAEGGGGAAAYGSTCSTVGASLEASTDEMHDALVDNCDTLWCTETTPRLLSVDNATAQQDAMTTTQQDVERVKWPANASKATRRCVNNDAVVAFLLVCVLWRRGALQRMMVACALEDPCSAAEAHTAWVELHRQAIAPLTRRGSGVVDGVVDLKALLDGLATPAPAHGGHAGVHPGLSTEWQTVLVATWDAQNRAFRNVGWAKARLQRKATRALMQYVWFGTPRKVAMLAITSVVSVALSKLAASGVWIRHHSEQLVFDAEGAHAVERTAAYRRLGTLLVCETLRMVACRVVQHVGDGVIARWSAQQREAAKLEVYQRLVAQPLSFYHLHTQDEIETMALFANDLEGVDVHMHAFVFRLQGALLGLWGVASDTSPRIVAMAVLAVVGHRVTLSVTQAMRAWWQRVAVGSAPATEEDLEVLENDASDGAQRGGWLFSGMEILASMHLLRPYGADVRLMDRWCSRMAIEAASRRAHRHGMPRNPTTDRGADGAAVNAPTSPWGGVRAMVRLTLEGAVALVDAAMDVVPSLVAAWCTTAPTTVRWALPLILATMTAGQDQRPQTSTATPTSDEAHRTPTTLASRYLMIAETMSLVEDGLSVLTDVPRLWSLVSFNGHKALTLQRLRSTTLPMSQPSTTVSADAPSAPCGVGCGEGTSTPTVVDAIRFNNVTFAYPSSTVLVCEQLQQHQQQAELVAAANPKDDRCMLPLQRTVLRHCSLSIVDLPGKLVCITGPSGCGKSTLLNLLMGLYAKGDPGVRLDGTIAVDVRGADGVSPQEVRGRQLFGYVPQTPCVFAGTVAQNVALEQHISLTMRGVLARVAACCRTAQCWAYVHGLPDGVMTRVAPSAAATRGQPGAVQLSGGQAQRLMIARALYSNCTALLMDEPTSNLDAATKALLLTDLRGMLQDSSAAGRPSHLQSIVAVTHDEVMLAAADVVLRVGME